MSSKILILMVTVPEVVRYSILYMRRLKLSLREVKLPKITELTIGKAIVQI